MARYLAQVRLPRTNGIPADAAVNTWAFETNEGSVSVGKAEKMAEGLWEFYNQLDPIMSPLLDGSVEFKVYDIDAPEPRVPIIDGGQANFSPSGTAAPEEVAIVLSFHGQYVSGEPNARRRGRVYIGPLNTSSYTTDGTSGIVVAPGTFNDLQLACSALYQVIQPEGILHAVWSRADDTLYDVVEYSADNRLDTQRRRGPVATQRIAWPWDQVIP